MMKLLIDTDAFCKLGVTGFLEEVAQIFEAGLHECGRLPALPYMLRKGRLRALYGAQACDALVPQANAIRALSKPSSIWLDKLTPLDGIDPGEAQIFASAAESGLVVVTNDKRALRSLKDVDDFPDALARRIVVLEAVLMMLCQRFGDDEVRRRIAPVIESDAVVKVCFSHDNLRPREALLSYYTTLTTEVRPLLLWDPQVGGPT